MSIEGLWTGELYGLQGWENAGVIVLESGRALGGGRHHFSTGTYKISGGEFQLKLAVEYHGKPRTLFGSSKKKISMNFTGKRAGDKIEGTVCRPKNSKQTLMFRMTKRAEIS
jgi:hypothetical protein